MTRDEVIKILESILFLNAKKDEALHMAIVALERKKGKWLFGKNIDGAYDVYGIKSGAILLHCSKCNFAHAFIDGHSSQYHYCPNCGADMRGEDD